jgi:hypothetical protein
MGGSDYEEAWSVARSPDGGCIVCGYSYSVDGDVIGNRGGPLGNINGWVVKLPPTAPVIMATRQRTLGLLCTASLQDTLFVRNVGMKPLAISGIAFSQSGPAFTLLLPSSVPDTIAPGDSLACIVQFSSATPGTFADTLVLINNDTISGHSPWKIAFSGWKDLVSYSLERASGGPMNPGDSLLLGELACGVARDTSFVISYRSTFATAFAVRSDNPLAVVPASVTAPADSARRLVVPVHFVGSATAGEYVAALTVSDTCGEPVTVYLKARVDSSAFAMSRAIDTTLCPGAPLIHSVWLHNLSRASQAVLLSGNNPLFSIAPDSLNMAPGDSAQLTITFRASPAAGVFSVAFPLPGCNAAQAITETVRVDSIRLAALALPDTTICPGDSVVRFVKIRNLRSQRQDVRVQVSAPSDSLFFVSPDSLHLGSSDSSSVRIVFRGAQTGVHTFTYSFIDACGTEYRYSMSVNVVGGARVAATGVPDAVVCPNATASRDVLLRNVSINPQLVRLLGNNPLFSATPDSIALSAGDSAWITVQFAGIPTTGTERVSYALPSCGAADSFAVAVHVRVPDITLPQTLSAATCPFNPIVLALPVTNNDSISRTISFAGSSCGVTPLTVTLGAGATDTLRVTFPGGAIGSDTCIVLMTDDCGAQRRTPVVVDVQPSPTVALSVRADPDPKAIGTERAVYVLAWPGSSLSGGISFTVENEPTALQFDSARTSCAASVTSGVNAVTIVLASCQAGSDTLAVLYYRTLIGSTLSPDVRIADASAVSVCDTVRAAAGATIALLPPGCELGTILVNPFSTALQSIYPNPGSDAISVTYSTIEDATVTIEVCDALGRSVRTIENTFRTHGIYMTAFDARSLANGVYSITIREGKHTDEREILLSR